MTFTQLEIFVAVVECQSFSLAANHLGISQSGVSHAISNLEAELGIVLIERHRMGISLTEIGKHVIKRAREMLGLHDVILQEAAATKGLKRGSVRNRLFWHYYFGSTFASVDVGLWAKVSRNRASYF